MDFVLHCFLPYRESPEKSHNSITRVNSDSTCIFGAKTNKSKDINFILKSIFVFVYVVMQ